MTQEELIKFVREFSPFYRELYRSLPDPVPSIEALPVLDQAKFWAANSRLGNQLLTGPIMDGLLLKSGGTTGSPKFSIFSRSEWNSFTHAFAERLAGNGLNEGDRVANLFYVGELYGSFLFTHKVFEECPTRVLQLPIGGSASLGNICKIIRECEATVIAGLPTTVLGLVDYLENENQSPSDLKIRMILFAGEAMYPDQRERSMRVFPNAVIRSIGYASTDAGFLGYADITCGPNEFRSPDGSTLFEILDEGDDSPIRDAYRPGRAVVTDLKRTLMPIIRYPVGDRAMWLEPENSPNRKFALLGRSEESGRVGPVSLYYEDLARILDGFKDALGSFLFQIVLYHQETRDGLLIRVATGKSRSGESIDSLIAQAIYRDRPLYKECMDQGKIHPIRLEWVSTSDLEVNPRSGKLRRIIDTRGEFS